MTVALTALVLLSQVAPGPWEQPLAPVFPAPEAEPQPAPVVRPTTLQTIGRGFYLAYRATLAQAKGPNCNFSPSCSLYGHQAIERLGLVPGLVLFGARLMRGHLNFDHFYRFDGPRLLDPLEETLDWLAPQEASPRWSWRSLFR